MPDTSACKSCGAMMRWVRSGTTNNLMCLDAEPCLDGNIVIKDGMAWVLKGEPWEEMYDGPRHKSHHATCPNAAAHRKKKK